MNDLTTHIGYMARFWELVSANLDTKAPMRNALFSLESELYSNYGVRRYSTYRSFSTAKSRKPGGVRLTKVETVQQEILFH